MDKVEGGKFLWNGRSVLEGTPRLLLRMARVAVEELVCARERGEPDPARLKTLLQIQPMTVEMIEVTRLHGRPRFDAAFVPAQFKRQFQSAAGLDHDLHGIGVRLAQPKRMQRHEIVGAFKRGNPVVVRQAGQIRRIDGCTANGSELDRGHNDLAMGFMPVCWLRWHRFENRLREGPMLARHFFLRRGNLVPLFSPFHRYNLLSSTGAIPRRTGWTGGQGRRLNHHRRAIWQGFARFIRPGFKSHLRCCLGIFVRCRSGNVCRLNRCVPGQTCRGHRRRNDRRSRQRRQWEGRSSGSRMLRRWIHWQPLDHRTRIRRTRQGSQRRGLRIFRSHVRKFRRLNLNLGWLSAGIHCRWRDRRRGCGSFRWFRNRHRFDPRGRGNGTRRSGCGVQLNSRRQDAGNAGGQRDCNRITLGERNCQTQRLPRVVGLSLKFDRQAILDAPPCSGRRVRGRRTGCGASSGGNGTLRRMALASRRRSGWAAVRTRVRRQRPLHQLDKVA